MANVSIGTVDRVIHNRGRVSKETREKVTKAILEIDYKPNTAAQMLSTRTRNVIAVLIPSHSPEDYWDAVEKGICKAEAEIKNYGFEIRRFYFDRYKIHSYVEMINSIKQIADINGYIISPQYMQESKDFANHLYSINKPFIFIDSNIEKCNQLTYFGIHSYKAGIVLSRLVLDLLNEDDEIMFVIFQLEESKRTTQIELIEDGFEYWLDKFKYKGKVHKFFISLNDKNREKKLNDFIILHPQVHAAVVFNSLSYELAGFFEKFQIHTIKIFGFDLIKKNIDYLKKGYIKFLISQRPKSQGYFSVKTLYKYLTFPFENINSVNFMPIDILMEENIDFYNYKMMFVHID